MSNNDLVEQFKQITGHGDAQARDYLQKANWNLEASLQTYFDSGAPPPQTFPTVSIPTPIRPSSSSVPKPSRYDLDNSKLLGSKCGLFQKNNLDKALPLQSVTVNAKIVNFIAKVKVSQSFSNNLNSPMEAVFVFQQEDCAIYSFIVEKDGKIVKGICKEKEEAKDTYDDSISSGHSGFLLEKSGANSFKMNIGNLQPGAKAIITFKYLTELSTEGDSVQIQFPITRSCIENSLDVQVDLDMSSDIADIKLLSSHSVDITKDGKKGTVKLASSTKNPSETLRFLVEFNDNEKSLNQKPKIILEKSGSKYNAMLSFHPNLKKILNEDEDDFDPFCEFIFLVDRSGSMSGSRINQAKNALNLFLRSLPEGTQFNIFGFGGSYQSLFTESKEYSEQNFGLAVNYVNSMSANLGGTSILPPLQKILSTKNPDYPKQVFVLTDGEVSNTKEVIDFVRKNSEGTRIFTFGIGSDASPELVVGMAKAGKGFSEFVVSGEGDSLETKVLRQLKKGLEPVLKHVRVEFPKSVNIEDVKLGTVFTGERVIVCWEMEEGNTNQLQNVKVVGHTANAEDKPVEMKVEAEIEIREKGKLVKRMKSWKRMKEIEDKLEKNINKEEEKKNLKNEIIKLSIENGLVSQYTSYVAVAENENGSEEGMKQINVNEQMKKKPQSINDINREVERVNRVVSQNIDAILNRGERLESLESGTEELQSQSIAFQRNAKKSKGGFSLGLGNILGYFGSKSSASVPNAAPVYDSRPVCPKSMIEPEISISEEKHNNYSEQESLEDLFGCKSQASSSGSDEEADDYDDCAVDHAALSWPVPVEEEKIPIIPEVSKPRKMSPTFAHNSSGPPSAPGAATVKSPVARAPANAHMRPLDKLVSLQSFQGFWPLTDELCNVTGLDMTVVINKKPEQVDQQIWGTVIALVVLEQKFSDLKGEWQLLANKARKWVRLQLKALKIEGLTVEQLEQTAVVVIL